MTIVFFWPWITSAFYSLQPPAWRWQFILARVGKDAQGMAANRVKIVAITMGMGDSILAEFRQRSQRIIKLLANGALERMPVELGRAELQRAVERQFPLTVDALVTLVFSEPCVRLDCGSDRMGLELSISAEIMGEMTPASRWLLTGELDYDRDTGEFFLSLPDICAVSTRADPDSQLGSRIRKFLVADVLGTLLSGLPVYQLKARDSKQALVRKFLHSIGIRDGKLAIWMHIE